MPINNKIDLAEKIVFSTCTGNMKEIDFDDYLDRIWSHNKYYGFYEIFDTVDAIWDEFNFGYLLSVAQSASKFKNIDPHSKLAWIVKDGKQIELVEFYKAANSLMPVQSRKLEAFYSLDDAMNWLKM